MGRQIAFLRGINLGSRRRVDMARLRELLDGLGYGEVRTYLQSGNVVLTSDAPPAKLEQELEREIAAGLGVDARVLVRTHEELGSVVARDPLGRGADDGSRYLVSFLDAEPARSVVRELATLDVAPERFVVHGRELYSWHPGGFGRSPLRQVLSERRLGVTATARNWNTVTALLALTGEAAGE